MLLPPLTGSAGTTFRPSSASIENSNHTHADQKTVQSGFPTLLQHVLPLQSLQSRSNLGLTAQSLTREFSGIPSNFVGSVDGGSTSLSGSSSLSSSLISLHSTPPRVCSWLNNNSRTPGQQSPTFRSSLWLKLRVCPSWVTQPLFVPPNSSTELNTTSPAASLSIKSENSKTEASLSDQKNASVVGPLQCQLYGDHCPYAHPSNNVRIEADHVTVCYDFIKRKNCTHSCCKYYHPPPHQIEAIIKRGDEHKKLLESQQFLLENKAPTHTIGMQPTQSATGPSGLASNFVWPTTTPLQPTVQASVLGSYLAPGGQALPTSLSPVAALGSPFVSASDPSSLSTSALLAAAAALQQQNANLPTLTAQSPTLKPATTNGAVVHTVPTNDRSVSVPNSFPNGSHLCLSSIVTSTSEPQCPTKRANQNSGYPSSSGPESEASDGAPSLCNGTCPSTGSTEQQRIEPNSETISHNFVFNPSSTNCSSLFASQLATSNISGLITSPNLYGLPFPSAQGITSPYLSTQTLAYSPLYPTQGTPDNPNAAAALALNTWLTQQQPHQPQPLPHLQTQVPLAQTNPSNQSLAAALAALQQQQLQPQPSSHELSAANPVAFQQQNQQALLLSLVLRAQQSQLAAAQMAAAVQAGYIPANPAARTHGIPTLPGTCLLDSAYSLPGAFTGIPGFPYGSAVPCVQNPITNVAYINEKGHLLETLPICRDFKAGKCHRNGDCRYVHLVDENVEVNQGRVIVCRDAAKGRCTRVPCKYYHVPLLAISANRSLALNSALATAGFSTAQSI